jgi:hypothetical protein
MQQHKQVLVDACTQRGLPESGTKDVLVSRLKAHASAEPGCPSSLAASHASSSALPVPAGNTCAADSWRQNIKFPFTVELAGDSIWRYEGPSTVTVTAIDVQRYTQEDIDCYRADFDESDDDDFAKVGDVSFITVEHDTTWNIYTDSGFATAISKVLGFDVHFTEQGMQDDGKASMELLLV